jgi:cytochrome P450
MASLLAALQTAINLMIYSILLALTYSLFRLFYNANLHPLSRFPGPLSHRLTVLPRLYQLHTGNLHQHVATLHKQYGPVVRISPNELAFTDPAAWKDIYGRKSSGEELIYDPLFYNDANDKKNPRSILGAEKTEHDAVRKALAPSFAPSALRAQGYANLLMDRLRSQCDGGKQAVEMTAWLNYFTFDVLGVLAFNSDFGCLQGSDYHPWVQLIMANLKNMATMLILKHLGLLGTFMWVAEKFKVGLEARRIHHDLTQSKVRQRLDIHEDMKKQGTSDFLGGMIDLVFIEL